MSLLHIHNHIGYAIARRGDSVIAAPTVNLTAQQALDPSSMYSEGLAGVNQYSNFLFAWVVGLTFGGLMIVTLMFRWAHMATAQARHLLTLSNPEQQRYWSRNRSSFWPKLKQNLLYAPLFGKRHNRELQLSKAIGMGTLPSRFHTMLLLIYLLSNLAYVFVLDYSNPVTAAVMAELRGRSGELATLNLIPTILFALRNNPFIPLLRVSYDTFNLLHRWAARMTVLQAFIHTVAYLINTSAGPTGMANIKVSLDTVPSYVWGMVSMGAFFVAVVIASSPIRHAFYETFLNLHRVLIAVGLVGLWYHIKLAALPQLPYLAIVFAMWIGEWCMRSFRIFYYNISPRAGMTVVTVEALPAEACRVTFNLVRPWKFVPGAHVHVYLPALSLWSSHPFSLAWAEQRPRNPALSGSEKDKPQWHMAKDDSLKKLPAGSISEIEFGESPQMSCISVVMRARTGMTRSLYNKASKSPNGIITMRGGIEGPYGGHESLSSFGTVILFAGGVGITHCISYVKYLLSQYGEGACSCRKILLVWSVPNTEALEWARPWMDHILRMEGRKEVLRIHLFISKPRHQNEVNSKTGTVQMFPGRCNPQTVLDKEVAERIGAVGITVCGPGAFADSVRSAARSKVQAGSVDFIEEAFTY